METFDNLTLAEPIVSRWTDIGMTVEEFLSLRESGDLDYTNSIVAHSCAGRGHDELKVLLNPEETHLVLMWEFSYLV